MTTINSPNINSLDSDLSAVNQVLGAIGQSPVNAWSESNPELSFIWNLILQSTLDVQLEGWHFNTEEHCEVTPDANGNIGVASNVIKMDLHDGISDRTVDTVIRESNGTRKLYDKVNHTDVFKTSTKYYVDKTYLYDLRDIPEVYRRYVIYRSCSRAAAQLVNNSDLFQMLQQQELYARAACIEYECNQGDPSFFGFPPNTTYNSYQPYRTLQR